MKREMNLEQFSRTLPYASEVFGVYQPILGWKSKRSEIWLNKGVQSKALLAIQDLRPKFLPEFELDMTEHRTLNDIVRLATAVPGRPAPVLDTVLMQEIQAGLPSSNDYDPSIWDTLLDRRGLDRLLANPVRDAYLEWYRDNAELLIRHHGGDPEVALNAVRTGLARESATAGLLLAMGEQKMEGQLRSLFYGAAEMTADEILAAISSDNPFDMIDPKQELDRVGLSPIGIAHLFRQYFFEFATFAGTPVGHVWISPGSTVELVETSTRRTMIERGSEQFLESITRGETAGESQDELSDAVKTDNRAETKFGVNVKGEESWIWGSASQSASHESGSVRQNAREDAHKHMRRQSEKLSTEIRKNYKSTLRVVTESTDTSSKRYVLTNSSKKLVNYELRRKMRQVGVQVQDIGRYLCWESYVDEPGRRLGISQLVHVGSAPEGESPHPEAIARPGPVDVDHHFDIALIREKGDFFYFQNYDEGTYGVPNSLFGWGTIQVDFPQKVFPPQPGYYLDPNVQIDTSLQGEAIVHPIVSVPPFDPNGPDQVNEVQFNVHLQSVNFGGQSPVKLIAKLKWLPRPSLIAEVDKANLVQSKLFTNKLAEVRRQEFVEAARERIALASDIAPRRFEDLREEERIVVYRALIGMLLPKGVAAAGAARHVASELINSIFDVDKMLYFVAPEWWQPRRHSAQFVGFEPVEPVPGPAPAPAAPSNEIDVAALFRPGLSGAIIDSFEAPTTSLPQANVSSWGGADAFRKDNYYVTEKSKPAKLGASLGWLLQLDGDDLRNAFLNAPWVKAVIPIRPGKSMAALNWLQQVDGMNGIGPSDYYSGKEPALAGKTMIEVLEMLAEKVEEEHEAALEVGLYPPQEASNANKVHATPVDRVFEHGFYPLTGGFRATPGKGDPANPDGFFEIIDQWTEILPTDQIVAVEVEYDPKTGQIEV